MLPIFESVLPIFLVIMLGIGLKRAPLFNGSTWSGLEQIGYWLLYPALIFHTILNADFSGLSLDLVIGSLVVSVLTMVGFVYSLRPLLERGRLVRRDQFSSVFQTAIRWNGFIALAVAQKIFPPAGMAVVALAMAAIIIPINLASVFVVSSFADRATDWRHVLLAMARNPMIIASLSAVVLRLLPDLYEPLDDALELVARGSLGLGLISIGAGLRVADVLKPGPPAWISTFLKLAFFPALVMLVASTLGVNRDELLYLALCSSVPTALNGYMLARQLGGDAELYAGITTLQTMLSFLTMPAVLAVARYIAG